MFEGYPWASSTLVTARLRWFSFMARVSIKAKNGGIERQLGLNLLVWRAERRVPPGRDWCPDMQQRSHIAGRVAIRELNP